MALDQSQVGVPPAPDYDEIVQFIENGLHQGVSRG